MTDPTETTRPRHRVDPMRPANPHTADPELQSFYEENLREGRTGPNLTAALILTVLAAFLLGIVIVVLHGLGLL